MCLINTVEHIFKTLQISPSDVGPYVNKLRWIQQRANSYLSAISVPSPVSFFTIVRYILTSAEVSQLKF